MWGGRTPYTVLIIHILFTNGGVHACGSEKKKKKKKQNPPLTFQYFHIFRFGDLIYFLRTIMLIPGNNTVIRAAEDFPLVFVTFTPY